MLTKNGRVGAAVATSLLVGTVAAQAATTFTVRAGHAKPGTQVAFTAKSKGVTLSDAGSGFTVACTSATTSGATRAGKHGGAAIAQLAGGKASLNSCSAFSGLLGATVTGAGQWLVNVGSVKNGVATGSVSRVHLNVSTSIGCSFTVKGRAPAHYRDADHALQLLSSKSQLTVSNASLLCHGAVSNGDKASLRGSFVVHATNKRFNPITVRR